MGNEIPRAATIPTQHTAVLDALSFIYRLSIEELLVRLTYHYNQDRIAGRLLSYQFGAGNKTTRDNSTGMPDLSMAKLRGR